MAKVDWAPLIHALAGALSAFSYLVNPVLPVIGFLVFFTYELNQDLRKDDWYDQEMREYGTGFFASVIALLVLKAIVF